MPSVLWSSLSFLHKIFQTWRLQDVEQPGENARLHFLKSLRPHSSSSLSSTSLYILLSYWLLRLLCYCWLDAEASLGCTEDQFLHFSEPFCWKETQETRADAESSVLHSLALKVYCETDILSELLSISPNFPQQCTSYLREKWMLPYCGKKQHTLLEQENKRATLASWKKKSHLILNN